MVGESIYEALINMKFDSKRVENALKSINDDDLLAALDQLISHTNLNLPSSSELEAVDNNVNEGDHIIPSVELMKSYDGKLFSKETDVQCHATKVRHLNLSKSLEEGKPLTDEEKRIKMEKPQEEELICQAKLLKINSNPERFAAILTNNEKHIGELEMKLIAIVAEKDEIKDKLDEMKKYCNSMQIDLQTNSELVKKYETQSNIDKFKYAEVLEMINWDLDDCYTTKELKNGLIEHVIKFRHQNETLSDYIELLKSGQVEEQNLKLEQQKEEFIMEYRLIVDERDLYKKFYESIKKHYFDDLRGYLMEDDDQQIRRLNKIAGDLYKSRETNIYLFSSVNRIQIYLMQMNNLIDEINRSIDLQNCIHV